MIGIIVLGNDAESLVTLLRLQELRSSLKEPILLAHKAEVVFDVPYTDSAKAMIHSLTMMSEAAEVAAAAATRFRQNSFNSPRSKGDRKGRKADRWR